jgi:predicted signal transduction protein with EAL and GGDEF domain
VGISLFPDADRPEYVLIRNADVAMYQAKARGRNGYSLLRAVDDGRRRRAPAPGDLAAPLDREGRRSSSIISRRWKSTPAA